MSGEYITGYQTPKRPLVVHFIILVGHGFAPLAFTYAKLVILWSCPTNDGGGPAQAENSEQKSSKVLDSLYYLSSVVCGDQKIICA